MLFCAIPAIPTGDNDMRHRVANTNPLPHNEETTNKGRTDFVSTALDPEFKWEKFLIVSFQMNKDIKREMKSKFISYADSIVRAKCKLQSSFPFMSAKRFPVVVFDLQQFCACSLSQIGFPIESNDDVMRHQMRVVLCCVAAYDRRRRHRKCNARPPTAMKISFIQRQFCAQFFMAQKTFVLAIVVGMQCIRRHKVYCSRYFSLRAPITVHKIRKCTFDSFD